ncbi:Uncharacterised protein [uncultured archaeon]|nr:Uncharacterised protein [uncultured archaeon]
MIILLVLVVWALYWLWKNQTLTLPARQETPLEIAKKRYAKGEITKKQFEDMKNNLG